MERAVPGLSRRFNVAPVRFYAGFAYRAQMGRPSGD